MDKWFDRPLDARAPAGGEMGCDGRWRMGGEFEPFFVPRPVMPQVDEADETALIEWLAWRGINVHDVELPIEQVKFHQRVDFNRVHTMPADVYAKPIWVSADGFVIDGNHRATAHKLKGEPVRALRIELEFEQAIAAVFSFAGTYSYSDGKAHSRF